MPFSEGSITSAGSSTEQVIFADSDENLYDAGPYDMGRYDVDLFFDESSIATGASLSEGSISSTSGILEVAISADDYENLADAGPADIGRLDVNIKMTEQSMGAQ